MNCKPGDLAVYVGADERCYGHIVRCIRLSKLARLICELPCWVVEPALPCDDGDGDALGVADSLLRPLRHPGNDAVDETLLWKPVPEKETA